ncbi:MAG TPA: dTDP-4-dehydrorhamnose reductase [Flavisolibacter sp.]|jgi:dTDP-4-dehydrorhamnose reductase|nr:dTDP-4-dehydrorhamnose reductase [Flavisolibacter sp.]
MVQNIIVTGSNGQLGRELQAVSNEFPSYKFHFFSRAELDIANQEQVAKVFENIAPHYCINCAAYTAVDKAEGERDAAFNINAGGARNLAAACTQHKAGFIHISTDYVFDGSATSPYKETHPTNPLGVYGASKLKGEENVFEANPESIIIRTSWVYSVYGSNFVKTMVRLMKDKPTLNVVADQWGCPTSAADLATAIMMVIPHATWTPGIYNFSNEGVINWFQFAEAIRDHIMSPCIVYPIPTTQYPTPAARPKYSVLDCQKIKDTFGIQATPWQSSLKICLDSLEAV